jgi:hypothetical protein
MGVAAVCQEDGEVVVAVDVSAVDPPSVRRLREAVLTELHVQVGEREHALHLPELHALLEDGAGLVESSCVAEELPEVGAASG